MTVKTVDIAGRTVAYRDEGTGRPVVLLHGFPLTHEMWEAQIPALSTRYRALAVDLRGFGRSTFGPEDAGKDDQPLTMDRMAQDVVEWLDAIKVTQPVVLGGLSMGGYIAFAFERRWASRLAGLMLFNTRAAADTPAAAETRRATAAKVLTDGVKVVAEPMSAKLLSKASREIRPNLIGSLHSMMASASPKAVSRALLGMAEREDSTARLGEISVPTLVLAGGDDVIVPSAEMQHMAQRIPGSTFLSVSETGHLTPLERPEVVNPTIAAFLDALPQ